VILFLLLLVILLIGLTTAAVMGRIGGFMADPTSSQAFEGVPGGSLSAEELGWIHFDQALRGYRMEQVDEVIDALKARLRELEAESALLREPEAALPHDSEAESTSLDDPLDESALLPGPDGPGSADGDPQNNEQER
jgi:DivIVA domain-containing protein